MTSKQTIHIGITTSAPWLGGLIWTLVASCMRTEATRRGIRITSLAAINADDQAAQLGELIDLQVDAIVMKPMATSHAGVADSLRRAKASGVPVVTLDSAIEHDAVVCTVGTDNAKAQAAATEFAFERLGHRGKVVFFRGDDRLASGAVRNASFHEVLAKYPGIELVFETSLDWVTPMWRQGFGADCMRAALAAAPHVDAVVVTSDESAVGAIDALAEAGLAGKVLVVGFDGVPEAMLAIRDGTLAATIRQIPERIAERALDVVGAVLDHQPVPRLSRVDTELVTQANVIDSALDSLRLVSKLIFDLSASYNAQRELQQAIIAKQKNVLQTIVATSDAVSRIREPERMMRELVDMIQSAFGLSSVAAYALDGALPNTLVLRAVSGHGAELPIVAQGQTPARESALFLGCMESQRSRLLVDDGAVDAAPLQGIAGVRSELVLPLVTGARAVGLLDLRSLNPKAFDSDTIDVLNAIAHQVAIALDNAKLYEETVRLAQNELRESEAKLALAQHAEFLSLHDALTTLPNRRLFNDRLHQALGHARRHQWLLAVMFIDLDRFKHVNDTLGHEGGDNLLAQAAERLKGCLRDSDTVARLGGDEFVVLLPKLADSEDPATVARKILAAIARPFTLLGHEFRVTASVGISVFPEDGLDVQALTKNADIAMYHAKKEGKNNFQFFSDGLNANSLERLALEARLREALERSEFRLHYQVKRDTGSGRITGAEVLLRWQHPDLGLIAPMEFLAVAEATGLTVPLGKWVLRTACRQGVDWQRQGLPRLVISVNLTERQFTDEGLVRDLSKIIAETGMEPELLELEITEKFLMFGNEKTLTILRQLKEIGVRLAIDDFGTGYLSLSALTQFPLDTIKIDRSFVKGVATVVHDSAVTEAIIAMGRTLSLTVVAQGVETQEQANFLRTHACDEFQGFYFNVPVPAEELAVILRGQKSS